MSSNYSKIAIFGASGNFGAPITAALIKAGFDVTIISRAESTATFPPGIPVIKISSGSYSSSELTSALRGHDAAVCAVGPAGIALQTTMVDAAEAAGVRRFVVDDFGWGPDDDRGLPEFAEVHAARRAQWDYARGRAEANPAFTWTGISIGNPIDWAMRKFPTMGFDMTNSSATIYDAGEEPFTGTTLEGIGQSVVGVLQHPRETANRFVRVLSIRTCQNELLRALEETTTSTSAAAPARARWEVRRGATTMDLMARGRDKLRRGDGGWRLDLVVAQLYDAGRGRGLVAPSREASDAEMLGVAAETAEQVVSKALGLQAMF